jgi:hypothetical protein
VGTASGFVYRVLSRDIQAFSWLWVDTWKPLSDLTASSVPMRKSINPALQMVGPVEFVGSFGFSAQPPNLRSLAI